MVLVSFNSTRTWSNLIGAFLGTLFSLYFRLSLYDANIPGNSFTCSRNAFASLMLDSFDFVICINATVSGALIFKSRIVFRPAMEAPSATASMSLCVPIFVMRAIPLGVSPPTLAQSFT